MRWSDEERADIIEAASRAASHLGLVAAEVQDQALFMLSELALSILRAEHLDDAQRAALAAVLDAAARTWR